MSDSSYLSFSSLSFERDDIPLFSDVSASLFPGQALQVVGPNGSGKTTLLRVLATSLSATSGEISWQGQPIARTRALYLSDLLFIGHNPGVKHSLTPLENLNYWRGMTCCSDDISNSQALATIGLGGYEDVPCYSLSAGQLRRVALTRLLISQATIWLLDEPFTAIDKQGVGELSHLFAHHLATGGIVILSTHQDLGLEGMVQLHLSGAVA